jgi:hypothetical protein
MTAASIEEIRRIGVWMGFGMEPSDVDTDGILALIAAWDRLAGFEGGGALEHFRGCMALGETFGEAVEVDK